MDGQAVFVSLLVRLRPFPRCHYRQQAGEVHHEATVHVPEVVAGLIEGAAVIRSPMGVDDENATKTLLAELGRQVHEDAAERGETHGISAGETELPADLVGAAVAERNHGEDEYSPLTARGDVLGQGLREPLVPVAIRERWQEGPVLLEDSTRQEDHSAVPVERFDFGCGHLGNPVDLLRVHICKG
jgi:hypothetical protein